MQCEPLRDALGLRVSLDADGKAHDLEILQMEVVGTQVKRGETVLAVELQRREIEDWALPGITHEAGTVRSRPTLLQSEDIGIQTLLFHHLCISDIVGACPETQRVSGIHLPVRGGERGHRGPEAAGIGVAAVRSDVDDLGGQREAGQADKQQDQVFLHNGNSVLY